MKFSFMVLHNPDPHHRYSDDIWGLRDSENFPYILPEATDPKFIQIDPIDLSKTRELMVKFEYTDTLDRDHEAFGYGGQSLDGTFMSVGNWHTITTDRGRKRSLWTRMGAYLFLQSERGFAMFNESVRRFLPPDDDLNKDWKKGRQKVVTSESDSDVSSGGPKAR